MGERKRKSNNTIIWIVFFCFFIGSALQCDTPDHKGAPPFTAKENLPVFVDSSGVEPFVLQYHLIATVDTIKWLQSLLPGDTLNAILVLNRIDQNNFNRTDTLVFPDSFLPGIDQYSPFPERLDDLLKVQKIILVSYYAQAFAVYEKGDRIKWGPASLGKESTPTPQGLFAVNWKAKRTVSTVDPTWIMDWYFNLDNFRGVSVHQYALPGFPASHSCVRLYEDDAKWLYDWIDQWQLFEDEISGYGTPVLIFGDYPFGQRKPWLNMAEKNTILDLSPANFSSLFKEFLPTVLERQTQRDSLNVLILTKR